MTEYKINNLVSRFLYFSRFRKLYVYNVPVLYDKILLIYLYSKVLYLSRAYFRLFPVPKKL